MGLDNDDELLPQKHIVLTTLRSHIEEKLAEGERRRIQLLERKSQLQVVDFDRKLNRLLAWRTRIQQVYRCIPIYTISYNGDPEATTDYLVGAVEEAIARKKQKLSDKEETEKVALLQKKGIEVQWAFVDIRTFIVHIGT